MSKANTEIKARNQKGINKAGFKKTMNTLSNRFNDIYDFLINNPSQALIGLVILLIVISSLSYWYYMIETENVEASNHLSKVLVVYNKGDYEKAIHGDSAGAENGIIGLSQIVENYSGTTSEDHARLYLGNSSLKLGKTEEAIDAFEGISKRSGRFVFAGSLSGLATCYSNLKDYTKAGELYWSAAEYVELDALVPIYLEQAARNYRKAGNEKLSIELLETIKRKFPESEQAKSADFYIDQSSPKNE